MILIHLFIYWCLIHTRSENNYNHSFLKFKDENPYILNQIYIPSVTLYPILWTTTTLFSVLFRFVLIISLVSSLLVSWSKQHHLKQLCLGSIHFWCGFGLKSSGSRSESGSRSWTNKKQIFKLFFYFISSFYV